MKMYDAGIIVLICILVIAASAGVISVKYLGHDNAVEEAAEEVIKAETGVNIDLSPSSDEKKNP